MDPLPPVRYATSGDVHIAFSQVGPIDGEDVVLTMGASGTMELYWKIGAVPAIGEKARVTWYDKRGIGQSEGAANFTFEERMDDIRAVMDEAGIESAHLGGVSEGGPMSILFAATYPERVKSLILYGTYPSARRRADYPDGWDMTLSEYSEFVDRVVGARVGDAEATRWFYEMVCPSDAADPDFFKMLTTTLLSSNPAAVRLIWENMYEVDVRHVLPTIRVPTTIVHRTGDRLCPIGGARYLAEHISGAKLVEVPGVDHLGFAGLPEWTDTIIEHLGDPGARGPVDIDRRLATVLFTDIVDSTPAATDAGDRAWSELLDRHDSTALRLINDYQGRLVKTTGDGVLATFDGPSRALRCVNALQQAMHELGLPIRAGLHTGEIEIRGEDIAGLAVHIASRISNHADARQTLVSATVKDVVIGAGFEFEDLGEQQLKGIDGGWHCYAVVPTPIG